MPLARRSTGCSEGAHSGYRRYGVRARGFLPRRTAVRLPPPAEIHRDWGLLCGPSSHRIGGNRIPTPAVASTA